MKERVLGKDLNVSPIGLGCMGFSHAYGTATDESDAVKVIQLAVEMGYSWRQVHRIHGDALAKLKEEEEAAK